MNRVCINDCMAGHRPECEETETHRSCLPREATRGLLCEKCFDSLREALLDAPDIIFHLRNIFGSLSSPSNDGSQKVRREPPAPINLSAFELSESIFELIVGSKIRIQDRPTKVSAKVALAADEKLTMFEIFVNQTDVKQIMPLVKMVKAAKRIFPTEEKEQMTAMPCPECDLRTIYSPPKNFGDSMRVSCSSCGFEVPPDKIAFYAHLAEKEKR